MEENHFYFANITDNKIVKQGKALLPEFLEGDIFCKDEEKDIINSIKSIAEGKSCENLFVHGASGLGKSVLINHILDHLKDYSLKVVGVPINCWRHSSSVAICSQIADHLGEACSRRGRATDELLDRILEVMRNSKIPVLLILDNVEGLLETGDFKLLHNLSEQIDAVFGIICISDDQSNISQIPLKIREKMNFRSIELKGHSKDQLFKILHNRAIKCLVEGSYANNSLERMAELEASNGGNPRDVLKLLFDTVNHAINLGKNCIDLSDVEQVSLKMKHQVENLAEEQQILIEFLRAGLTTSSQIYSEFNQIKRRSNKHILKNLKFLERLGIVKMEPVMIGKRMMHLRVRLMENYK